VVLVAEDDLCGLLLDLVTAVATPCSTSRGKIVRTSPAMYS